MDRNPISTFGKIMLALALFAAVVIPQAQAQKFKVVYSFTGGKDGGNPLDGVIAGSGGTLYATTNAGGASGNGTVFEISKSGEESVLYSFAGGSDGANPTGGLIFDKAGNLYGTTSAGGGVANAGTIFEITAAGQEEVLYAFPAGSNGASP